MADIKNFGIKGIASDVQMGKSGGRLVYDSANNRFKFTESNGSTLEDVQFGSVTAGTWTGTAIATQYGGTGQDFSSSTGVISVTAGVASAGALDLSNTSFFSGILAVANGGTGASDAANARTNLGLGSISTQDANSVALTGGSIDGVTIGGNTAAAATFSNVTVNGVLTGNVVGNLTGTAANATVLETARNFSASGDATAPAVSFDGSGNVDLVMTLANSGVSAGTYGDATNIPQFTVDAKGRVTSVSNISISTSFGIAGDSGTDTVAGGETLTVVGANGQISTAVTNNQIEVSIVDGASIANLTVTGTFTSDDITSSSITIDGNAVITGNLTVQGTQTIINSTTVSTGDAVVRVNSDGAVVSAGLEANVGGTLESILYNPSTSRWELSGPVQTSDGFVGDLTGNVTGTVSDISNHDTGDLAEGTNLYYTTDRANSAMDAYISGGVGLTYTGGTIDLDNTAVVAGSYGNATSIPTFTVDAQGRLTAANTVSISTYWTLAGDTGSSQIDGADTANVFGGTNITTAVSGDTVTIALDDDVTLAGNLSAVDGTFSGDIAAVGGTFTGDVGAVNLTASSNVSAVNAALSGDLSAVNAALSGNVSAVDGTFSGGVSAVDVTASNNVSAVNASLTGDLSAVDGVFSGNVSASSLTDGVATLTGGDLNAVDVTASGTVQFGSLSDGSITIVEFTNDMASAAANNIATAAAVKTYVDNQLGNTTLAVADDSGSNLSIDLDDETFGIFGGTGLTSTLSGNNVSIALDDTSVSANNYGSASTVATFTVDAQGRLTAAANATIDITASQVNDFNSAVDAHLVGGVGIDYSTGTIDLANTAVTAGTYGDATNIPQFTVDAQGRITAASNIAIATNFSISGDNGSDDVINGGETLTITGAASQIETTITNNTVTVGIVDGASIANLTVTGTFTSDDITSSQVTVSGDAIITGNLTVQGTQTILNTATVQTEDSIFRVNSGGATGANVGFEANVGGNMKSILYTVSNEWNFGDENVVASTFEGDLVGNADTATALATARTFSASGDASATGVSFDGSGNVDLSLTLATVNSNVGTFGNATTIPVVTVNAKGLVTAVSTESIATTLNIAGDSGSDGISLLSETLTVAGGTNLTTVASANTITVSLDNSITLSGNVTADTFVGNVDGATVEFTSLSDGTTSVTTFVTESAGMGTSDNDTSVPTTAAVIDYVANNAGDGLLLRGTFTADSSNSSFTVGTMPNVSSRTYYADKIVIKVGTGFSGGTFDHILVKENGGSGTTLVANADADAGVAGTYVVQLTGDETLTKNAGVVVQFMQADGTTPSVVTAGSMTATVHYNFVG